MPFAASISREPISQQRSYITANKRNRGWNHGRRRNLENPNIEQNRKKVSSYQHFHRGTTNAARESAECYINATLVNIASLKGLIRFYVHAYYSHNHAYLHLFYIRCAPNSHMELKNTNTRFRKISRTKKSTKKSKNVIS